MLEIGVLGPLLLAVDGVPLTVNRARERAVLSLLAAESGRAVSADRMIDGVWGEKLPTNPLAALQTAVSRLRRAVGADVIVTGPGGYALNPSAVRIDVDSFEELVNAARGAGAELAASKLDEALALWRGAPYDEFEYQDFVQSEVARLDELRLAALELRALALLGLGRHDELVSELQALVVKHPLRETLWAHLMVALYRSGRQADALAAYQSIRNTLIEQMGLEPGPLLRRTEERILTQDPALESGPTISPARVESAVPQRLWLPSAISPMLGREDELRLVKEMLRSSRLVTVTGPAGVGKTRLALEAAHEVIDDFEDGVVFIGVDALDDSWTIGNIARYAADGLTDEAPVEDQIVDLLRGRCHLIVLDGCERLTSDLAGALTTLLERCREITILASSRQRFGVNGEAILMLRPLPLPQPGESRSPATDLFIQRAPSLNPEDLDPATVEDLARITSALDGLPLGIELAAARSAYLPLSELAEQLEHRTDLLASRNPTAPPRHQSLRAAIATSWDALEPEHQELLLAVSTLSTPWGFEDAARMLDPPGTAEEVERAVLDLVDRSLLLPGRVSGPETKASFTMLRPIREFAAAALENDIRAPAFRRRHAEIFQSIAARFRANHDWGAEWGTTSEVEERIADIENTLNWLTEHDANAGLRMACNLGMLWTFGERRHEGERHLRALLSLVKDDSRSVATGRFLLGSLIRPGGFSYLEAIGFTTFEDRWHDRHRFRADDAARTQESVDLLTEALATWGRLGLEPHRYARVELARSLATAGDFEAAERVLGAIPPDAARDVICFKKQVLARIAVARGEFDVALEHAGDATCEHAGTLQVFQEDTKARIAIARLDWEAAARHLETLLAHHTSVGNLPAAAIIHLHLGIIAASSGDSATGRHHAGRALELGRRFGISRLEPLVRLTQASAHFADADYPSAIEYASHSIALSERLGDRYGIGLARVGLGVAYNQVGNPKDAVSSLRMALGQTTHRPGSAQTDAGGFFHLANSYYLLGRTADAARLLGAESQARLGVQTFIAPGWADDIDPRHALEDALGPDRFATLFEEGRGMWRKAAFELALAE